MMTPYCKTRSQNGSSPCIISPVSLLFLIKNKPIDPANKVMISWLMLPTIVREITRRRLPSSIYKILPRYSPILLGVLTENETPDKIALNDLEKLIG